MEEKKFKVVVVKTVFYEKEVIVTAKDYNGAAIKAMQTTEGTEFTKVHGEEYSCTDMEIIED